MGFWSSFFGAGAAHVYNEMKKEEKETQKWNDNLHMTMNYEEEFSNYLKSIGSNAVYISEVDESAASVRNQIDRYKRKIKEFLNLGGEGKYIYDVEEIDEYIEVMKYLKFVDCIDRQEEFLGLDLCFAKDTIEREKEEQTLQKESEIAEIIGTDINSLSGIEFEKVCQKLVENMGFETETTKASGDGGIDLIAYNHQPLLSGKYIIQCKRYTGSVGEPIIRDLYGVITSERANKGILMTTGTFTKSAIAFADGKPIELIDGEKLHGLLSSYGIAEFDSDIEEVDNRTAKDIFLNNVLLDFQYERYVNTISELDITNDEKKRAEFINWLMYLTLSMVPDIDDFQEKLIIFKEIKNQIKEYLCQGRTEKSKWLAYLYQATYVQLSILEGDFCDAKEAFEKLMENKELQIPLEVTTDLFPEPGKYFMYEHTGIFTALCYTWYDMVQVAIIMDDDLYKSYLIGDDKFYGYPSMEKGRLWSTVEDFNSGRRTEGNRNYFSEKLNEFEEIEILVYENAPLRRLYIMSNYELDLYYKYTYEDEGEAADLTLNDYKVALEGNVLKIEEIGEIKNIRKKIQKWKT